ncbi:MAG: hypothetical protein WCI01_09975 [Chlorobiaceae bacterium]
MPKKLENSIAASASKKGLKGEAKNAYVFGTMDKIHKSSLAKGESWPGTGKLSAADKAKAKAFAGKKIPLSKAPALIVAISIAKSKKKK